MAEKKKKEPGKPVKSAKAPKSRKAPVKKGPESGASRLPAKRKNTRPVKQEAPPPVPVETPDPRAIERGDTPMTVVGHLDEMRSRLIRIAIALVVLTFAGFYLSDYVIKFIQAPFLQTGQKLNLFTLMEGVMLRLKAGFFASVLLCVPLLVFEVWRFLYPAIEKRDRMYLRLVTFAAVALFYGGVAITYVFLPMIITTLISFAPTDMVVMNNASEYLHFFLLFSAAMGLVFELPIIILILTRIGIVSPSFLVAKRKYAIVIIWVGAAILTPTPDPFTLSLVAIPLMLLYELSIFISRFVIIRRKKQELRESSENA